MDKAPGKRNIRIVYEDQNILIVNKPSGRLVVPARPDDKSDLTSILNLTFQAGGLNIKAHPCHRLDRETSGLVIFAKGKKIQKIMMQQFHERQVKKAYIAFIQGYLKEKSGMLKSYIEKPWPYPRRRGREKLAMTKFKVLKEANGFSVVELEPLTGRTNQIRLQFKDLGHPLLGERRFSFARDWPIKFRRTALHAWRVEFLHPVTAEKLSLVAPLSQDMKDFLVKEKVFLDKLI